MTEVLRSVDGSCRLEALERAIEWAAGAMRPGLAKDHHRMAGDLARLVCCTGLGVGDGEAGQGQPEIPAKLRLPGVEALLQGRDRIIGMSELEPAVGGFHLDVA